VASTLADLLVKMDLDSAKYRAGIQKSQEELKGFAAVAAEASKRIEHLLEFEVVIHGAEKFAEFLRGGAEAAEQLVHLSEKVGTTVEDMSRLSFAARQSGLDAGAMGSAMGILSKGMEQAQAGTGKAAAAFDALKIKVTDSSGQLRSNVAVMQDVAERFGQMENGAGKTALAMLIFGKAGADMVPLLNRGREGIQELMDESDKLGRTMSGEVARGAKEFNEDLLKLEGSSKLLAASIAANLAPSLTALIKDLAEGSAKAQVMKDVAEEIATGLRLIASAGLGTYAVFGVVGRSIAEVAALGVAAAHGSMSEMRAIIAESDRDINAFSDRVKALYRDLWNPSKEKAPGAPESGPKAPAPLIASTEGLSEQEKAVQRLQREIASLNEKTLAAGLDSGKALEMSVYFGQWAEELKLSGAAADELRPKLLAAAQAFGAAEEQVRVAKEGAAAYQKLADGAGRMEVSLTKLEGATELERTYQSLMNGELAKEIALAEAAGKNTADLSARYLAAAAAIDVQRAADEAAAEALRQHNEAIAEAKSILSSHAGPLERYHQQLEKINDAYRQGALTAEQYRLALDYAQKDFVKAGGVMNDFAKGTSHALEGAFSEFFQNVDEGLGGLVASFGRAMMQMVAQAYAAKLAQAILNPSGGGLTGAANGLGNLLGIGGGGGGGGYTDMGGAGVLAPSGGADWGTNLFNLPGYAAGGDIRAGQLAVIGEEGPELFSPNVSGSIVPNHKLAAAAGAGAAPLVTLQVHPDAMHMTLREWFEGEMARQASQR
jgi:hypothetical protein